MLYTVFVLILYDHIALGECCWQIWDLDPLMVTSWDVLAEYTQL